MDHTGLCVLDNTCSWRSCAKLQIFMKFLVWCSIVVLCAQFFSFFLFQTANGNVEAKVVCFYRRRDISSTLIVLADKHASKLVCVWIASTQNCQTWARTFLFQLQVSILLFLNVLFLYTSSGNGITCLAGFSFSLSHPLNLLKPHLVYGLVIMARRGQKFSFRAEYRHLICFIKVNFLIFVLRESILLSHITSHELFGLVRRLKNPQTVFMSKSDSLIIGNRLETRPTWNLANRNCLYISTLVILFVVT